MSTERKNPKANLRTYYTILLETGLIFVLLLFIVAVKVEWQSTGKNMDLTSEQEVAKIEDIIQTKQEEMPAPPPRPQAPVEVPNDEIIEDEILNINAEIDMGASLELPPPPGDDEESDEEKIFMAVEHDPELIGGQDAIYDAIEYPRKARLSNIEGTVYLQFVVNKQGEVVDPVVVRGIGGGCDEEALRVIKQMKFKPGRQRGNPVSVRMGLPIVFKLTK